MTKTVIILGAGWAGLPLAHKLLKYTVPKAKDGLKVILISPNSHFYWNLAAVRGIIPGAIADDQLFIPIGPAFAQHAAEHFRFVLGRATRVDPELKTVEVTSDSDDDDDDDDDSNDQKAPRQSLLLPYDELIIATGSRLHSDLPLKPIGKHAATLASLHALQHRIAAARSIVIAGAGPTGVEVAGELAAAYGTAKAITLVGSGERVLQAAAVLPSVSRAAERDLRKLGVELVCETRVVAVNKTEGGEGVAGGAEADGVNGVERADRVDGAEGVGQPSGPTTITLSNGNTLVADLYLPLSGVQVNTSFLPLRLLDANGNLKLDQRMRAIGTEHIWGIGDVGNLEPKQVTVTDAQIIHVAAALHAVLTGSPDVAEYRPAGKTMVFVTMGKRYATGQIGAWRLWGWLVAFVKGRTLFVDTARGYVAGEHLRHAAM